MTQHGSLGDVLGHYSLLARVSGDVGELQPLLAESSPLFAAIVGDSLPDVEALLASSGGVAAVSNRTYNVLHWSSSMPDEASPQLAPRTSVSVKSRTLLAIASYHGSLNIVKALLRSGADPSMATPDGTTAFMMAHQGQGAARGDILSLLQATAEKPQSKQHGPGKASSMCCGPGSNSSSSYHPDLDASGSMSGSRLASTSPDDTGPNMGSTSSSSDNSYPTLAMDLASLHMQQGHKSHHQPSSQDAEVDLFNTEGLPYSTSELTAPEFSSDDFRMFSFKVLRCCKRFAHDWRACPFAHPTENARRRDPREFRYSAIACPDYKQGFCVRGDLCTYAHGVFEAWLHPSRYRSQLCKDGANCHRAICFFAHSLPELRTPTHMWTPGPDDVAEATRANTAMNKKAAPTPVPPRAPPSAPVYHTICPAYVPMANAVKTCPYPDVQMDVEHNGNCDPGTAAANVAGGFAPVAPAAAAAAMFGFTAPRMSNSFARRHGLNPKDNAMLNLQKIALQAHVGRDAPTVSVGGSQSGSSTQAMHGSPLAPKNGLGNRGDSGRLPAGNPEITRVRSTGMQQVPQMVAANAVYYAPPAPVHGAFNGKAVDNGCGHGMNMMSAQSGGMGGNVYSGCGQSQGMAGSYHGHTGGQFAPAASHNDVLAMQVAAAAANRHTNGHTLAMLNQQLGALNMHQDAMAAAFAAGHAAGMAPMLAHGGTYIGMGSMGMGASGVQAGDY